MSKYSEDKRPEGLEMKNAITGDDTVIFQKKGERFASGISFANFLAGLPGMTYRADSIQLTLGVHQVDFKDGRTLPDSEYIIFRFCMAADGMLIGNELLDQTVGGFEIEVYEDCTLTYIAIPKN